MLKFSVVFLVVFVSDQYAAPFGSHGNLPQETQRAQCTITAGDIQASAEATVSKTMEGVCGSDEMKAAFYNLEIKLMKEIDEIKNLLESMQSFESTESPTNIKELSVKTSSTTLKSYKPVQAIDTDQERNNYLIIKSATPKKNLTAINRNSPRDAEVQKLNNTMLTGGEIKLFAYYWKLNNFSHKLESNISTEFSPVFSILGKHLRLKAVFNHLSRDFLYLQLEKTSSNVYEKYNSIVLETDGMFKQIQTKIYFKHKISILEQTSSSNDLTSQEFTNTENGFLVPNSALLSSTYIKNDTILIKLIVYL